MKNLDPKAIDLTGRRFGRLVVLAFAERITHPCGATGLKWKCRCDCGVEKSINGEPLRSGRVVSCGCHRRQAATIHRRTHGCSTTLEYKRWRDMRNRCNREKTSAFKRYGARGIKVCQRWNDSFEAFLADMGLCPSPDHQIERKDNDGPYSPENCAWATRIEQANNKRTTVWLEIDGQRKPLNDWSRQTGVPSNVIHKRIKRGWSHKDAAFLSNGTVKVSVAERWRRRRQTESNPEA